MQEAVVVVQKVAHQVLLVQVVLELAQQPQEVLQAQILALEVVALVTQAQQIQTLMLVVMEALE
jgi:hypothetical protein